MEVQASFRISLPLMNCHPLYPKLKGMYSSWLPYFTRIPKAAVPAPSRLVLSSATLSAFPQPPKENTSPLAPLTFTVCVYLAAERMVPLDFSALVTVASGNPLMAATVGVFP